MSKPKILTDIEKLQLVGKYHVPEATREILSSGNVSTTNPIPTSWTRDTVNFNRFYNGEYSIESSVGYTAIANYLPSAFDTSGSTYYSSITTDKLDITITLPEALTVTQFTYSFIFDGADTLVVTVQGSNDKSGWTSLYEETYTDGELPTTTVELTNTGSYKYYRLQIVPSASISIKVYVVQISSYMIPTYRMNLVESDAPSTLDVNQRIMVKTPSYTTTGITSMTFNGESIDTILRPNMYYELVYSGTKYAAKEVV